MPPKEKATRAPVKGKSSFAETPPAKWSLAERAAYRSLNPWTKTITEPALLRMTASEVQEHEAAQAAKLRQAADRAAAHAAQWRSPEAADARQRELDAWQERAARALAQPRSRARAIQSFVDDVLEGADEVRRTTWGPSGDDARVSADLRMKVQAADDLAWAYAEARVEYTESSERLRGEAYANAIAHLRALDGYFRHMKRAWDEKWTNASEPAPRCHDEKILAHMREATAWYRGRVARPTALDEELQRILVSADTDKVKAALIKKAGIAANRPEHRALLPFREEREEGHIPTKAPVRLATRPNHPDRPKVAKAAKVAPPVPTTVEKRAAKRTAHEEKLLRAIGSNCAACAGKKHDHGLDWFEKQLGVGKRTLAAALERLLTTDENTPTARADDAIVNRGSKNRPKLHTKICSQTDP